MQISEIYKIYSKHPNICTDTRQAKKGSLFFAIKGEKFNGNHFAKDAIHTGCSFAIIDEKRFEIDGNYILVKNVLETLQELAKYHRNMLSIPIIGITGTNGKTTSKELIHSVLNKEINCYATKGNLNNHIGVPLSILEIRRGHDAAIIEMGANHEKEIQFLCNIVKPTHGVITNIGSAHLEGFKNKQNIINTKNELYESIKNTNGLLFVNKDDKLLDELSIDHKKNTYGIKSKLNISIINNTPFVILKWRQIIITTKLIGEYQLYNISLAICIGDYFNISKKNIQAGIESYIPKNNRSEITKTKSNTIIMDAYNANPSSMIAMLNSFSKQEYKNKLCILGDMYELGDFSYSEHLKIIKICQKLNLETVFIGAVFNKIDMKNFKNLDNLISFIKKNPIKNKTILLKGSRGVKLEDLVPYL